MVRSEALYQPRDLGEENTARVGKEGVARRWTIDALSVYYFRGRRRAVYISLAAPCQLTLLPPSLPPARPVPLSLSFSHQWLVDVCVCEGILLSGCVYLSGWAFFPYQASTQ